MRGPSQTRDLSRTPSPLHALLSGKTQSDLSSTVGGPIWSGRGSVSWLYDAAQLSTWRSPQRTQSETTPRLNLVKKTLSLASLADHLKARSSPAGPEVVTRRRRQRSGG